MANEKFYVTQEGYNDLVNEHENLVHKVRQEVIVELQEARAQGDLSENADYDSARDKQAHIESRIKEIDQMLLHVQIIDESVGGIVNAECVKETYLLDTEDVYVGHLFLAISKCLTWDATK